MLAQVKISTRIFLTILAVALALPTYGQNVKSMDTSRTRRRCGTTARYNELFAQDLSFRKLRIQLFGATKAYKSLSENARLKPRTQLTRVPVVVHVIYKSEKDNVVDSQIRSQIEVLNNDYQNIGQDIASIPQPFRNVIGNPLLKFELAAFDPDGKPTTGIVRIKSNVTLFYSNGLRADRIKSRKTGGDDPWDSDKYLNIWVCPGLRDKDGQDIAGYSSLPASPKNLDGVVIVNDSFGTNGTAKAPYDKGRTATHEVGHWLNLLHIWGDDEFLPDTCSGSDQVDDTPNQSIANQDCPNYPHPSCGNSAQGGDMFMNYMDYSPDSCMRLFTAGQVLRMETTLDDFRSGISESPGLAH